jgi:hypothetical protein
LQRAGAIDAGQGFVAFVFVEVKAGQQDCVIV